jgi:hypothetical protein
MTSCFNRTAHFTSLGSTATLAASKQFSALLFFNEMKKLYGLVSVA